MKHLHSIRLPMWGLSITAARYYGYRFGLHIGPWLIFVGRSPEPPSRPKETRHD